MCVYVCVHSTTLHATVVDVANPCSTKQWFFSDNWGKPTTTSTLFCSVKHQKWIQALLSLACDGIAVTGLWYARQESLPSCNCPPPSLLTTSIATCTYCKHIYTTTYKWALACFIVVPMCKLCCCCLLLQLVLMDAGARPPWPSATCAGGVLHSSN